MRRRKPAPAYKGGGYWAVQIGASALLALLCLGGGLFIMFAPPELLCHYPCVSSDSNPGEGVILVIVGLVFLGVLISLLGSFLTASKEQRARYAWTIMQLHSVNLSDGRPINVPSAIRNDLASLALAKRARRGELTRTEIEWLQSLRPSVRYPGWLPPASDPPPGNQAEGE